MIIEQLELDVLRRVFFRSAICRTCVVNIYILATDNHPATNAVTLATVRLRCSSDRSIRNPEVDCGSAGVPHRKLAADLHG